MLDRNWIPAVACATALVASVSGVAVADGPRATPSRFVGAVDGAPVQVTSSLGQTWSAWAYFAGGEYSIALSRYHDDVWTEPVLLGLGDGLDQIDPVLEVDDRGNIYLAYCVRETGAIFMSARFVANAYWFEPRRVTGPGVVAADPVLRQVTDRLVLAYRRGDDVTVEDFELLPAWRIGTGGIQEGPDGFPLPSRYEPEVRDVQTDDDDLPKRFGKTPRRSEDKATPPYARP